MCGSHCRHLFHKSCVDPWLLDHRTCPMCKMNILKALGIPVSTAQPPASGRLSFCITPSAERKPHTRVSSAPLNPIAVASSGEAPREFPCLKALFSLTFSQSENSMTLSRCPFDVRVGRDAACAARRLLFQAAVCECGQRPTGRLLADFLLYHYLCTVAREICRPRFLLLPQSHLA